MGGYRVDGPQGPCVESPEEMVGRFQAELMTVLPAWRQKLAANPGQMMELEQQVHAKFSRGADLLIVGLMAVVTNTPEFSEGCEQVRQGATVRLTASAHSAGHAQDG